MQKREPVYLWVPRVFPEVPGGCSRREVAGWVQPACQPRLSEHLENLEHHCLAREWSHSPGDHWRAQQE